MVSAEARNKPPCLVFSATNVSSVAQKQLMESLRKKLGVLREAQRGLQDDVRANAQLGEEVGQKQTVRSRLPSDL